MYFISIPPIPGGATGMPKASCKARGKPPTNRADSQESPAEMCGGKGKPATKTLDSQEGRTEMRKGTGKPTTKCADSRESLTEMCKGSGKPATKMPDSQESPTEMREGMCTGKPATKMPDSRESLTTEKPATKMPDSRKSPTEMPQAKPSVPALKSLPTRSIFDAVSVSSVHTSPDHVGLSQPNDTQLTDTCPDSQAVPSPPRYVKRQKTDDAVDEGILQ